MNSKMIIAFTICTLLLVSTLQAGVIDPDCDAGKAAKSAATKAVVGVGGRCDPKEAASDTLELDDRDGVLNHDDKKKDKNKNKNKNKKKDKKKDDDGLLKKN